MPGTGPAEIDARLRLLVGRRGGMASQESAGKVSLGELVIDEGTYTARLRGRPLDLTYKEFELLKYLAQHAGRVFTRAQLLQEVWGYDFFGGTRTVDVHVRRLRAKLGPEYESLIGTVRNVGYKAVRPARGRPAAAESEYTDDDERTATTVDDVADSMREACTRCAVSDRTALADRPVGGRADAGPRAGRRRRHGRRRRPGRRTGPARACRTQRTGHLLATDGDDVVGYLNLAPGRDAPTRWLSWSCTRRPAAAASASALVQAATERTGGRVRFWAHGTLPAARGAGRRAGTASRCAN